MQRDDYFWMCELFGVKAHDLVAVGRVIDTVKAHAAQCLGADWSGSWSEYMASLPEDERRGLVARFKLEHGGA